MKLGEVYQLKKHEDTMILPYYLPYKIIISRFATNNKHISYSNTVKGSNMKIIADVFQDEDMLWVTPSDCIYFNNKEEILEDYELFMTQEQFQNYIQNR